MLEWILVHFQNFVQFFHYDFDMFFFSFFLFLRLVFWSTLELRIDLLFLHLNVPLLYNKLALIFVLIFLKFRNFFQGNFDRWKISWIKNIIFFPVFINWEIIINKSPYKLLVILAVRPPSIWLAIGQLISIVQLMKIKTLSIRTLLVG